MSDARLNILLVEDNPGDARLIREMLRDHPELELTWVEDLRGARERISAGGVNLVLLDLGLPDSQGAPTVAAVHAHSPRLPIVVLTGHDDQEAALQAVQAGAQDYLVKGQVDANLLVRSIRYARERQRGEEALRQSEERLLISDRMASMGMLAAAMAHEINNPLAVISANLDLARLDLTELAGKVGTLPELASLVEELGDAFEACQRVRVIMRDLSVFSRVRGAQAPRPVDVRPVLDSSLRMAGNEIRHRARLVRDYQDVPPVAADEARLGQVFLNLAVNAAQAIPEGQAQAHQIRVATHTDASGRVVVEMTDTGCGMSPEVLGRVFTPFFTTKPPGAGTGLGLFICRRILTALGGEIAVDSQLGKGTTVRVTMPAITDSDEVVETPPPPAAEAAARRGTILVVDDDARVARAARRVLARGHEVQSVASASRALAQIAEGQRFDVILCDLMMPRMTGMDLHAELMRVAPEQAARMVFVTGGAFTPRARAFLQQVENVCIEKPFDLEQLRAVVERLLR